MPCPGWVTDASTVLETTAVLTAIAIALTAAELLALGNEFRTHGLFDPRVLTKTGTRFARALAGVSTLRVAGAQMAFSAIAVIFVVFDLFPSLPFLALAAATVAQRFLLPYGGDGSDMMARVLTITLAVALPLAYDSTALRTALLFIAGQLCLAYGASGVAKLFGAPWRSGVAVQRILHTGYGHPGLLRATVDRRPSVAKSVTWLVVAVEIAFPMGIVLGGWAAFAALVSAALLQLGIAVSMGLNRFTPWFFAAFPATMWGACNYGMFS